MKEKKNLTIMNANPLSLIRVVHYDGHMFNLDFAHVCDLQCCCLHGDACGQWLGLVGRAS